MEERHLPESVGVLFLLYLLVLCADHVGCTTPSSTELEKPGVNRGFPVVDAIVARLEASTDAPGLIRAPVGFQVKLVGPQDNSSIYDYTFEAHERREYGPSAQKGKWVFGNESLECSGLFAFDETGDYDMKIMVKLATDGTPIAKTNIKFSIWSNILGTINVEQAGVHPPNPKVVSTKTEALLSFVPHDPHNFLNGSLQLFGWSLNGRPPKVSGPSVRYNFSDAVDYTVMLMVTIINNTDPRISYFGAYTLSLKARDPIENFNVTGLTSMKHGDLLELDLSCVGSPPFSYCWRITRDTVNVTNQTCVDPTVTTECDFYVIRYFRQSGNYKLVVIIENEIAQLAQVININVFDNAAEPQLVPIIVPLVCSCLVLVIVVVAVMYYIQTRRQHSIEVADFDFQQSDSYEFRTFFRHVLDTLGDICHQPRKEERRYSYTLIHAQVT